MRLKGFWREPLLHFLVLGTAMFFYFHWSGGGSGPSSTRIVLTAGQIEHLAAGFARTWQRPADEAEMKGLIDDWVREEIAVREAMAMGLDRDDAVIRRRLRQKLEFIVEEFGAAAPPTEPELQAWLDAHPGRFRSEPEIELRQVYVSTDRRGESAVKEARALLSRLESAGPDAKIEELGDPSLLPQEIPLTSLAGFSAQFGAELAAAVAQAPAGVWSGPYTSGFGLHLVFLRRHVEGRAPTLAEVRPAVETALLSDRRAKQLASTYDRLLAKYRIAIERGAPAAPAAAKAGDAKDEA